MSWKTSPEMEPALLGQLRCGDLVVERPREVSRPRDVVRQEADRGASTDEGGSRGRLARRFQATRVRGEGDFEVSAIGRRAAVESADPPICPRRDCWPDRSALIVDVPPGSITFGVAVNASTSQRVGDRYVVVSLPTPFGPALLPHQLLSASKVVPFSLSMPTVLPTMRLKFAGGRAKS